MNTISLSRCFALLLGLSAAGALSAADQPAPADARVTVVFDHPEKYMDLKDDGMDPDNEEGQKHFLPLFREHIEKEAGRLLPAGHKLAITFTDIDLAGDYEPWRSPQMMDVRIVKSVYPPRLTFTFRLTDENGRVLSEGERKLVDLGFQMRITRSFNNDLLRYEKDMLTDWLRDELKARKN